MINPTSFQFESTDHSKVIRYEVGFFHDSLSLTPVFLQVYVPTMFVQAGNFWAAPLVKPLFGMNLCVRVKAVGVTNNGTEIDDGWSDSSNQFDFAPNKPTLVGVF